MRDLIYGGCSGRSWLPESGSRIGKPLVIAIHGGTYTSGYFDVPGFSLLENARRNEIAIIALDRPGYGKTPLLPGEQADIQGQADHLTGSLKQIWTQFGGDSVGMVLIGHSIGAAIAASIASGGSDLPLIGLAMSGVGLRTPELHRPMWESLPDIPLVEMPEAIKDDLMFGNLGSFDTLVMPQASHSANAPAPKAELVAIVSSWQETIAATLSRINVPVHYRQAENDKLWIVDQEQINGFAKALTAAPWVDARMMPATGHCMDFHHIGLALQIQQLGFALQCATEAARR